MRFTRFIAASLMAMALGCQRPAKPFTPAPLPPRPLPNVQEKGAVDQAEANRAAAAAVTPFTPDGQTPPPKRGNFGYKPDPDASRDFIKSLPAPTLFEANPELKEPPKVNKAAYQEPAPKEPTLLYRALYRMKPDWAVGSQGIGDCVSWGWAHGVDVSLAVDVVNGRAGEFRFAATEAIYGGSRVEARGRPEGGGGYSDGSYGAAAAKWVNQVGGVIWRQQYSEPAHDLTLYSSSKAKQWGNWGCGGQGDNGALDAQAKKFPASQVALVQSFAEAAAAIESGYPVPVCSGQGFSSKRDQDGFSAASGSWAHCMCFIGVRYNPNGLLCLNSWGCYKGDMEILTATGWQRIDSLERGVPVATLNPESHQLEYRTPTDYHEYEYCGELWDYKSRDIDLSITPNHNLYVCPRRFDIERTPDRWKLLRADECPACVHMKKDADWDAADVSFHGQIPMDTWIEFLGYWVTEGWTSEYSSWRNSRSVVDGTRVPNGGRVLQTQYAVGVAQSKPDSAAVIRDCLSRMPHPFTEHNGQFTTNNKSLARELGNSKAHEKRLPDYVWTLSRRQLRILYDAMMLGDGSYSDGPTGQKATFYTSSPGLADDFQRLLLHIGYAGDVSLTDRVGRENAKGTTRHIEYRVGIKRVALEPTKGGEGFKPEKSMYSGSVYCVTVPNNIVYVRRNGRAVWCGNSKWVSGPKYPDDQPDGSFWVKESTATRMLSGGDSFAVSHIKGFPKRQIRHDLGW